MHVFICPNCGHQELEQQKRSGWKFVCWNCSRSFCIVDVTGLKGGVNCVAPPEEIPELDWVQDLLDRASASDKGVSL